MHTYKRKIIYLDKFENGEKGKARGYLKLEVRDDKVKLSLNINDDKLPVYNNYVLYFYYPEDDALQCLKIAELKSNGQSLDYKYVTPLNNAFQQNKNLYTFSGVALLYNENYMYVGDFEGRDIDPVQLRWEGKNDVIEDSAIYVSVPTKPRRQTGEPALAAQSSTQTNTGAVDVKVNEAVPSMQPNIQQSVRQNMRQNASGSNHSNNEGGKNIQPNMRSDMQSNRQLNMQSNTQPNMQSNTQPNMQPNRQSNRQLNMQSNTQPNIQSNMQPNMQPNRQSNMQPDNTAMDIQINESMNSIKNIEQATDRNMAGEQNSENNSMNFEDAGRLQAYKEKIEAVKAPDCETCQYKRDTGISKNTMEKMFKEYPKLPMYENSEIYDCVRIAQNDIGLLDIGNWRLGSNSFVSHGYYTYKYLMLGKIRFPDGVEKVVLGVPGIYANKEKYLANMFGFEQFIPVKKTTAKMGQFGYWIVEISPYL